MRYQLFMFLDGDAAKTGIGTSGKWFDLAAVAREAGQPELAVHTIDILLERWVDVHPKLTRLSQQIHANPAGYAQHELSSKRIVLLAPLTRPGAIYGAGANYRDHVEAMSKAFNMNLSLDPKADGIPPWHFLKAGRANLSGHEDKVPFPKHTQKLDWEAELAVVIGRETQAVSVEHALDYVAGYMCANDLSARDQLVRQAVDPTSPFRFDWIGHKSFSGSCPLGPVFTPAEFVGSPENLDIKLWLNGELKQDSNTRNHLYSVAEQIAYLSSRMRLYPGDVILTGTPAGVGMESGVFLKPGDVMQVQIEGLGKLETILV